MEGCCFILLKAVVRVRISLLLELFVLLGLLEGSILSPDQDCGVLVFVFSFVFVLFSFGFDNPVRFVFSFFFVLFSFGFDNPVRFVFSFGSFWV